MGGVCPSTPEQKPTPKLPIGDLRMCVAFVVNLIVSLESFFFRRPGVLYDMCDFNNPNAIACFGSAVLSTTGGCTKRSLFFLLLSRPILVPLLIHTASFSVLLALCWRRSRHPRQSQFLYLLLRLDLSPLSSTPFINPGY